MKVNKDGGFTKISQMAGSFQNWIVGGRRPHLVTKDKPGKVLIESTRHLILHAFISQRRALQATTMRQAETAVLFLATQGLRESEG